MRALGAFFVALAAAVAVAAASMFLPKAATFESATDFGLAHKAFDFLLTTGAVYGLLLGVIGGFVALPFAIALCVLKLFLHDTAAAVTAGVLGAVIALVPLAALSQLFDGDEAPFAVFRAALPITMICGFVGGLVFAILARPRLASGS